MIRYISLRKSIFWTALIVLSAAFYFENAVVYLFGYRNARFAGNEFWFIAHILGAACSLFLGPIQFWKSIRTKYIRYHRLAGKIYIFGSLIAGVAALRLSLIFGCVGCRFSLFPLSILFILTTALAWYAITQKNITAHKQFMVRSYTCALAFVFVRLYQVIPMEFLFGVIDDPTVKRVVIEWMFSILPLLIVEIVMIWMPSLKTVSIISNKVR
ncbi:MAG: DUF2306 domain-containing protein [Flammeovirgaceae bacterium]|nr:DUF2306 domain-containing protein [Flammeovirgaceae bacterium]